MSSLVSATAPSGETTLAPRVAAAAAGFLAEIALERLDPAGSITPSSRKLCAGLGVLAQAAYAARGGAEAAVAERVGLAGAMLSLLTKLEDQVIDARAWHAGWTREAARLRTRAYLAPTLASIRTGAAADDSERCVFAARLGRLLRELGPAENVATALGTIARGWEVQERAVATLTRHASEVSLDEVALVTREISGVWLMMIAEIGTIPTRGFTDEERAGFLLWGDAIQKADALNDLRKDIADGHWSSFPLRLLYARSPAAYEAAAAGADVDALLAAHGVVEACMIHTSLAQGRAALAHLGSLPLLLDWIHAHLTARWHARRA